MDRIVVPVDVKHQLNEMNGVDYLFALLFSEDKEVHFNNEKSQHYSS